MFGFVYLWFDRKHKRFYIGSHWGTENDRYICSSRWMRKAYQRRPTDFKRRILQRVYTSRQELLVQENLWLGLIDPKEIKIRYYNLRLTTNTYWHTDDEARLSVGQKISRSKMGHKLSIETKDKISKIHKGRKRNPTTEETKLKISLALKGKKRVPFTDERKASHSLALKGKKRRPGLKRKSRKKV